MTLLKHTEKFTVCSCSLLAVALLYFDIGWASEFSCYCIFLCAHFCLSNTEKKSIYHVS